METIILDCTPKNADDPKVVKLLSEIRRVGGGILSDAKPVYVPVSLEVGVEANECFPIVSARVEKDGGNRILGWNLREESVVMSAEFHAVWESPNGELLDITPKGMPGKIVESATQILFVHAPEAKYQGKQVNNINLNISGNPLGDDFIACHQAIFDIMNRGKRACQHGEIELKNKEKDVYCRLQSACAMLPYMVQNGITIQSPCLCGSGKKFKHCHAKIIRNTLESARKFR